MKEYIKNKKNSGLKDLFNSYIYRIDCAYPIRPCHLSINDLHCKTGNYEYTNFELYFKIKTLKASLQSIYVQLVDLDDIVKEYLNSYLDWKDYAIHNVLNMIRDGAIDVFTKRPNKWTNEELKEFTVIENIKSTCFCDGFNGEFLGKSGIDDFKFFTSIVYNFSSVHLLKAIGKNDNNPEYKLEEIETEINESNVNELICLHFELVIGAIKRLRFYLKDLDPFKNNRGIMIRLQSNLQQIFDCYIDDPQTSEVLKKLNQEWK